MTLKAVSKSKAKEFAKSLIRRNENGESWRALAVCYGIPAGTLNRFANSGGTWLPKNEEELTKLGLIVPRSPYAIMPRWWARTPEALQAFDISFHIYMPEHLAAVGKFAKELQGDSMDDYHPFPEDRVKASKRAQELLALDPLFLDTETTGLDGNSEIVEIAILNAEGETVLDTLVKPTKPIPASAQEIHHITDEMVASAPTFQELMPELERILRSREVLVYNAEFDESMLTASARLNKCEFSEANPAWYWSFKVKDKTESQPAIYKSYWHCIMKLYAKFYGDWNEWHGNYRWVPLARAASYCGIEMSAGIHHARVDAELARQIVKYMAEWQTMPPGTSFEELNDIERGKE